MTSKIYAKSCRTFDAVLGCILGAPGDPQARKVWFSLSKTEFFEDPPFRPRAPPRSILEPKTEPKWTQNGAQNRPRMGLKNLCENTQKRAQTGAKKRAKRHPKRNQKPRQKGERKKTFKKEPVLANEREARKKRKSCNRTCEYAESVPELLKQS